MPTIEVTFDRVAGDNMKHADGSSRPEGPYQIGFLLLDNFTMISLASAIDPLRMANQLSGKELYNWFTFSENGTGVCASDGLEISADLGIETPINIDSVIVVGGVNITNSFTSKQIRWLRRLDQKGIRLGGICTGAYVLAAAGLLDGQDCSAHWECIATINELFPKVNTNYRLFSISERRLTSSGGIVPIDMMLDLIRQQHSSALVSAISDMFICDRVRSELDSQRVPLRHSLGTAQPKLVELIELMENNLEEPIELNDLAQYLGISRRQQERLFQKHLNCTPSRYYLNLRLTRARQLLKQTSMSIIEIATACGFVSTPHFSKCYRDYHGTPPSEERRGLPTAKFRLESPARMTPSSIISDHQSASSSLTKAKHEPSFGSVKAMK